MDAGMPVMGMGQPQHRDGDPRAEPIHLKQEELGTNGVYHELQRSIEKHFHARRKKEGKSYVGVNVVAQATRRCRISGLPPTPPGVSAASHGDTAVRPTPCFK